jgi:hypothetical protein
MDKNILFPSFFGSLVLSLEAGCAIGRLQDLGCNPAVYGLERALKLIQRSQIK